MSELEIKLDTGVVCYVAGTCASVFVKIYEQTGMDMNKFSYLCFNNTKISRVYFNEYCGDSWWFDDYCVEDLLDRVERLGGIGKATREYDTGAVYWVGYLWGYWTCKYGEDPKKIWEYADFDELHDRYPMFHTLDLDLAIEHFRGDVDVYALMEGAGM